MINVKIEHLHFKSYGIEYMINMLKSKTGVTACKKKFDIKIFKYPRAWRMENKLMI